MTLLGRIRSEYSMWIGQVTEAIVAVANRIRVQQHIHLIENDPNTFTMSMKSKAKQLAPSDYQFVLADEDGSVALPADWAAALRGSRLEVVLRSSRFLFRPLDFPKRAADFLDGMIRSQIDRLTPWTASDAFFSWSTPVETSADRISLTVAAAPKTKIAPLIRLAELSEAGSVTLYTSTDSEPSAGGGIKIFEKRMRGSLDTTRIGRILTAVLLIAAVSAALSLVVANVVGGRLESEQQQLTRKIAEGRAARKLTGTEDSAQNILARRKRATASTVMVLEALSGILPDDTYVTELRIEKDRLQIVGITQQAPALVRLIEQSPHFTRATFFAPTTRASNDPGERFHVEARIKPYFGPPT